MPITYSVDHARGIAVSVWTDVVTAEVLGNYWQKLLHDPEVLRYRRTLVDLRRCQLAFSGHELSELVMNVVRPLVGDRRWKTALVVAEPVQYGVSRQYQVFAAYYSEDAIFADYDAALSWLTQGA